MSQCSAFSCRRDEMAYWNEKNHSSYDNYLRGGGRSRDLPRISYGIDHRTPASMASSMIGPKSGHGTVEPASSWFGTALTVTLIVALGVAVAAVTSEPSASETPNKD